MPRDPEALSDLQLAVMRALWDLGEARVGDVHAELEKTRTIAATTVATLLARLEKRGAVTHRREGRHYVYRAARTEEEVSTTMLGALTRSLFRGRASELIAHLIREQDFGAGDLDEIRRLLEEKRRN